MADAPNSQNGPYSPKMFCMSKKVLATVKPIAQFNADAKLATIPLPFDGNISATKSQTVGPQAREKKAIK